MTIYNRELSYDYMESPIGMIFFTFTGSTVTSVTFHEPEVKKDDLPHRIAQQIDAYFRGKRHSFDMDISFGKAGKFYQSVWAALRDAPYGETRTYKWLAAKVGTPGASRAVGQALGRNPLPIIVPCHRIIASDGSLGGFTPGVDIKKKLLQLEGCEVTY